MDGANATSAALAANPDMLSRAVRDMLAVSGVTVVADLPAGHSPAMAAVLAATDLLVVPVMPEPSSVAQMPAIESGRFAGIGSVGGFDAGKLRFVINQWGIPGRLAEAIGQGAAQQLKSRLLGAVRHDPAVPEAVAAQRLLCDFAPTTDAARDMAGLAAAIVAQIEGFRRAADAEVAPAGRPSTLRTAHVLTSMADLLPRSRSTVAQKADR